MENELRNYAINRKICRSLTDLKEIEGTTNEDIVFRQGSMRINNKEKEEFFPFLNDFDEKTKEKLKENLRVIIDYKTYQPNNLKVLYTKYAGETFTNLPNGMYTFAIAINNDQVYTVLAHVTNPWEVGARHSTILKDYKDKILAAGEILINTTSKILTFNFLSGTFVCGMNITNIYSLNKEKAKEAAIIFGKYASLVHIFLEKTFPRYKIKGAFTTNNIPETLIEGEKSPIPTSKFLITYCKGAQKDDIKIQYKGEIANYSVTKEYNYCDLLDKRKKLYKDFKKDISDILEKEEEWDNLTNQIKEKTGLTPYQIRSENNSSDLDSLLGSMYPPKFNKGWNLKKATEYAKRLIKKGGYDYNVEKNK